MNIELFKNGLDKLNIEITQKQLDNFSLYSKHLVECNKNINLTAITDDDGISIKHFLDCILLLKYVDIPKDSSVADIGTGAGFPGLPIKIMREDVSMCLIDSLNKRVNFLNELKEQLSLDTLSCIHARAEDLSRDKNYRESFDFVVSRAVANLTVLCEYCLPYIKVGGSFVALKSSEIESELESAKPMIGNLGGKISEIITAPLPNSDIVRSLIVIKKIKQTPKSFPRTAKKIKQGK